MAKLEFRGKVYKEPELIRSTLQEYGVPYEQWGTRDSAQASDEQVLTQYKSEVDNLMANRGYVTVDLVALNPNTPNLDAICKKFDKEHHHVEDEVRFTVAGEGVFEINVANDSEERLKFTAEPGDLIVIPANRRHLFYLTDKKHIRCIRLFKTQEGWEALYDKAQ